MNINQFTQAPVRGQLDLQIQKEGVLSVKVGANQSGALKAGDRVKLDSGYSGAIPQVVKAAAADDAIGTVVWDVKQASYAAGDMCQIAMDGKVVQYHVASETINPGQRVQMDADGTCSVIDSGKELGWALDAGVANGLFRVVLTLSNAAA